VQTLRREWLGEKQPLFCDKRVFFLDETGASTALTRPYGRACGGKRAVGNAPKNDGKQINILSAMSQAGVAASLAARGQC
jgi:hypothetical protein